jgi:hypothetical protein
MSRAVFRVGGQYRVAVIDLKPIDIALTVTGLMTVATPTMAVTVLALLPGITRRAWND